MIYARQLPKTDSYAHVLISGRSKTRRIVQGGGGVDSHSAKETQLLFALPK